MAAANPGCSEHSSRIQEPRIGETVFPAPAPHARTVDVWFRVSLSSEESNAKVAPKLGARAMGTGGVGHSRRAERTVQGAKRRSGGPIGLAVVKAVSYAALVSAHAALR